MHKVERELKLKIGSTSTFRRRRNLKEEEHIRLYKRLMNKAKIILVKNT